MSWTNVKFLLSGACSMALLVSALPVNAITILAPGDAIIGIDTDPLVSNSLYPINESPDFLTDDTVETKYVNFGGSGSGFIVTPNAGSTVIRSFQLTTANDVEPRDPSSFELYGTNDVITSLDNSMGLNENYTLIAEGDLSGAYELPSERSAVGPVVDFANSTAYSSYKMIFPTTSGTNFIFQLAEASFFESIDGSGADILNFLDPILAVHIGTESQFPGGEAPSFGIDGYSGTKYLNFGNENSGFIVTPASGPSVVKTIEFTTANDHDERDPASFSLYGTNDTILSGENSQGNGEAWTLIDAGVLDLPMERQVAGNFVTIDNDDMYNSYRLVFDSLRGGGNAGAMQIADVQFYSTVVPEPTSVVLVGLMLSTFGMVGLRRRS